MPGLIGMVARMPGDGGAEVFARMLAPMRRGGRLSEEVSVDRRGAWALGRVRLGPPAPSDAAPSGPVRALVHGDLENEAELRDLLASRGAPVDGAGPAAVLAELYRLEGAGLVHRLRGAFLAALFDEDAGRLLLVNDLLGSYPLYWFSGPERFVFASELKSLLKDPAVRPELDPRALADFFAFGFLFGEKTLASGVALLPAGGILTFDSRSGECSVGRYHRLETLFSSEDWEIPEYHTRLTEAFNRAVGGCLRGSHAFVISLSGGLDSRAVLSAADCRRHAISTYTLGVDGCADEVIAEKLASLAETRHHFFELDDRYLGEFLPNLRRMVSLTDGMYLTHGLTEMLAMDRLREFEWTAIVRGHGGELAKTDLAWPLHTDDRIRGMQSAEELVPYLLERVSYISGGSPVRALLTEPWLERVDGGARRSCEEALAGITLSPADLASYLYLSEHHRRYTVASLELFRNVVDVRLPFVDVEFLRVLFSGPPAWRSGTAIHRAITGANRPDLLRVRNSNTGAPGDAGPLLEAVLDKFNSLFKRLNLRGYRHYHRFEAWMEKVLLRSVEETMLDPLSRSRGIYREETLRRWIEETRRGAADHSYLLQILLLVELWQRENVPA